WFRGPAVGVPAAVVGPLVIALNILTVQYGIRVARYPLLHDGTGHVLGATWIGGMLILVVAGFVALFVRLEQRRLHNAMPGFSASAMDARH
ncbi:MAG: hypothetical protein AB7S36_11885, partial [Planctomycetota bacterium]